MGSAQGGRREYVQHFRQGDVVLARGTFAREAIVVLDGEIEVRDRSDTGPFAVLGQGSVFGDVFVFRPGICPVEVRARSAARVRMVGAGEVREILSGLRKHGPAGGVASAALRRLALLCARRMDEDIEDFLAPVWSVDLEESPALPVQGQFLAELQPVTDRASSALDGRDVVVLSRFPALIGRRSRSLTPDMLAPFADAILLSDDAPYQISRRHLILRCGEGGVVFEDADSRLGSSVQGVRIGGKAGPRSVTMGAGLYDLALGNSDTPYRFRIVVRRMPEHTRQIRESD